MRNSNLGRVDNVFFVSFKDTACTVEGCGAGGFERFDGPPTPVDREDRKGFLVSDPDQTAWIVVEFLFQMHIQLEFLNYFPVKNN